MKRGGFKHKSGFRSKSGFKKEYSPKDNSKKKRNGYKTKIRRIKRKNTRWDQIIRCDRVFSQLVRLLGADQKGQCRCFTCGRVGYWKRGGIECGHYRSRSHMTLRWDLHNAKPQCSHCNQVLSGNLQVYAERLGKEIISYLDQRSKVSIKLTDGEIRDLRLQMEKQVKQIREDKGL